MFLTCFFSLTHLSDNYFRFNSTHFTDGIRYYPYSKYATNGVSLFPTALYPLFLDTP